MANQFLCTTPACLHYSSHVLWNMAPSHLNIDPCTDFEQFVCYGAKERVPENTNTFSEITEQIRRTLRNIVESDYQAASNYTSVVARDKSTGESLFDDIQRDYKSCMNSSAIQAAGLSPLKEIVVEIRKKLSVSDLGSNATLGDSESKAIGDTLLYLKQIGVDVFAQVAAGADYFDQGRIAILLQPGQTSQEQRESTSNNANNTNHEQKSTDAISQLIKALLPVNITDQQAADLGDGVASLKAAITDNTPEIDAVEQAKNARRMTPEAVAKLSQALGYDEVVKALVPMNGKLGNVTVMYPDSLRNISTIVSKTPKAVVQAYLIFQAASSFSQDLDLPVLQLLKNDDKSSEPQDRWKEYLDHVQTSGMKWVLSRLYVTATLSQASKKAGDDMLTSIREQLIKSIDKLPWISAEVKGMIALKVRSIIQVIGYQSSSPDNNDIEEIATFYKGFNITTDYFANLLPYRRWDTHRQFSRVGEPTDRRAFEDSPAYEVNAHADLPAYLNYGGLGVILGHELTHAFDNTGRQFNSSGRFEMWWDNKIVANFGARAECFVNQYSNYSVPTPGGPRHVNGSKMLGENIADAGGLHLAFDTWKSRRHGSRKKSLPGLEHFTHEQLFYISFANTWCSTFRAEGNVEMLDYVHSPDPVRIKGTIANSRGFREAFSCPAKEPTCELW